MDIVRLEPGNEAPELEDRIRLTKAGPTAWRWGGNVSHQIDVPAALFRDCPDYYPSRELAENDALRWAAAHGAEIVYVEVDED